MTDKCFLCRQNTKIRKCTQCSLKAHNKCWFQFISHRETVSDQHMYNQIECPQCKCLITKRIVVTRSMTLKINVDTFVEDVKNYLDTVEVTHGRENKTIIVSSLFEYLLKNICIVKRHRALTKAIQNKLIEFHRYNILECAGDVYEKMFRTPIPHTFIT